MGLEVAAAGLLIGGGVADAVGKIGAGNAAERAGNLNAKIALDNAKRARVQGDYDEGQLRANAAQTIGAAKADYGAAGVKQSGSVLSVLESSAATAESDAMNIRQQTDLNVRQYKNEAKLAKLEGKSAKTSSRFGAASSILGGISGAIS